MIGKLRPQIFMALFMLSLITGYAIYAGMVEIATGTVGGLVALGMKVLEKILVASISCQYLFVLHKVHD